MTASRIALGAKSPRAKLPRRGAGAACRTASARPFGALLLAVGVGGDDRARDLLLGDDLVVGQLADDLAAREDDDPVAEPLQLEAVGGDDDHRDPLLGDLTQVPVDLDPGAGVDALGRLVDQQQPRLGEQRPRQHHFLLVAAGEARDEGRDRGGA